MQTISRIAITLLIALTVNLPFLAKAQDDEAALSSSLLLLKDDLRQLSATHTEQIQFFREYAGIQHDNMMRFMATTDKIGMALYSQSNRQTLQLAFLCNKTIAQCENFEARKKPIEGILLDLQYEISRYERLISTLKSLMPQQPTATADTTDIYSIIDTTIAPKPLFQPTQDNSSDSTIISDSTLVNETDTTYHVPEADSIEQAIIDSLTATISVADTIFENTYALSDAHIIELDSCIALATRLRDAYLEVYIQVKNNRDTYLGYTDKITQMREYAERRYNDIQTSIFQSGQTNYLKRLKHFKFFYRLCKQDLKNKYLVDSSIQSRHSRIVVLSFVGITILWVILSTFLSKAIVRHIIPKKLKTNSFIKKQKYYVMAASMLIFSVLMILLKPFYNDDFINTATNLYMQFSLLMVVIMSSLIFRFDEINIHRGLWLYMPIIITGFIILTCRITFMPDAVLAFAIPPLLIIITLWQTKQSFGNIGTVPTYDTIYGYMSLAILTATTIASLSGYTMLSIYIFSWWLMQLTCLHAITSLHDGLRIYEDKWIRRKFFELIPNNLSALNDSIQAYYKRTGEFLRLTWLADFINIVAFPVLSIISLPFCIIWTSKIFDLDDTCQQVMVNNFIDIDGLCQLSIFKIIMGTTLFFVFRYFNYILNSLNKRIVVTNLKDGEQGNVALVGNLISVLTWGAYGLTLLILLNVSRSGISIVVAGLATGIGFAMRDLLNNFFYGLSLMMGRLKVGEMIECDNIRGQVESINYQSTQIKTVEGNILSILNSTLFNNSFKNLTRDNAYELVKLPIGVAYGTKIEEVRKMLTANVAKLINPDNSNEYDIDPVRGISVALVNFGDSSVDLTVNFYVRVMRKPIVCAKVNEVIYNTLCQNNIEIPFPQADVHIKN